jgi:hypothetical protein
MRSISKVAMAVFLAVILLMGIVPLNLFANAQVGSITYDSGTRTITVSGFTASNPASFGSLWDADQAGHWNVIEKQGTNQFIFHCLINVRNGFFNDTDKQITLGSGVITANGQYFIGGSGTITFGKVVDYASKTSSNGVSFYSPDQSYWYYWIWTRSEYIYSSLFDAGGWNQAIVYATVLWNSIATGKGFAGFHAEPNGDFFNVICSNTHFGIYFDTDSISAKYDKISLLSVDYGIRNWGNGNGATISNVYARNCTYLFNNEALSQSISQYLVNVDADNWTFSWVSQDPQYPQTNTSTLYRQYTFDLTVTNSLGEVIPNAVVKITNSAGGSVLSASTDAEGKIPTKALALGFYNNTGGSTMFLLAPYTLTITANGYYQYNTSIPATEKTNWHIALQALSNQTSTPYILSRFSFSPSNPTTNTTLTFDGSASSSSTTISSYAWNFGDNTQLRVLLHDIVMR